MNIRVTFIRWHKHGEQGVISYCVYMHATVSFDGIIHFTVLKTPLKISSPKKNTDLCWFLSMLTVLVLAVKVSRHPSLRFLAPPQHNGGEWKQTSLWTLLISNYFRTSANLHVFCTQARSWRKLDAKERQGYCLQAWHGRAWVLKEKWCI